MLMCESVQIKWHYSNRKHFESQGYIFTKYNDVIDVKITELPKNSTAKVLVKCDYCGKIVEKSFDNFLQYKEYVDKDACNSCKTIKGREVLKVKHGVDHNSQLPGRNEKVKQTQISKYGMLYCQTDECKKQVKQTTLERYGVENISHSDYFKDKYKDAMMNHYGVENGFQSEEVKQKIKDTNIQKFGVEHIMQNQEIQAKARKTRLNNGGIQVSTQQLEIYNMLKQQEYNVELNYPVKHVNPDVAIFLDNIKIDLEYDGWYWHNNPQQDRRRDEFLKSQGWKVLRIKSGHKIPTLEQIQDAINKLKNTNRTFTQIVLDDWKEKLA